MILTKAWLEEFLEFKNVSSQDIIAKLNSIGLEVTQYYKIKIPHKVVVARIKEIKKHSQSDKLNICQVQVDDQNIQNIVCGANNVAVHQFVAVALLDATLPNGLTISQRTIRGENSVGMICSSEELGLPKINDGIMVLDDSIGELVIGKPLREYKLLNDEIIEIELTPNRGDCMSIKGVSRDLVSAFELNLNEDLGIFNKSNSKGIGRMLQVIKDENTTASVNYKIIDIASIRSNLLFDLRLALIGFNYKLKPLSKLIKYSTHACGVLIQIYNYQDFYKSELQKAEVKIDLIMNKNVVNNGETNFSEIGLQHYNQDSIQNLAIVECSYVHPKYILNLNLDENIKKSEIYNLSVKGSNPNLRKGMAYFCHMLDQSSEVQFYSEDVLYHHEIASLQVYTNLKHLNCLIGKELSKNKVTNILRNLFIGIHSTAEQNNLVCTIPNFRHDLHNEADIAEEVLRFLGIDQIDPKSLQHANQCNIDQNYQNYKQQKILKNNIQSLGFYECIHFVFANKSLYKKYGLTMLDQHLDLINGISKEMNTLRTTLALDLIQTASFNANKSKKIIKLFEIASIFRSDRQEAKHLALLHSGYQEAEQVKNNGKPEMVSAGTFMNQLKGLFPKIEFVQPTSINNALIHPNMSADLYIDEVKVGYLSQIHPKVLTDFDLQKTFVAELNLDLINSKQANFKYFSKFQITNKDLSFVLDEKITFRQIKNAIQNLQIQIIKKVYPVALYQDENMQNQKSLSIRLELQDDKTLTEEVIKNTMETIISLINKQFKAKLR